MKNGRSPERPFLLRSITTLPLLNQIETWQPIDFPIALSCKTLTNSTPSQCLMNYLHCPRADTLGNGSILASA